MLTIHHGASPGPNNRSMLLLTATLLLACTSCAPSPATIDTPRENEADGELLGDLTDNPELIFSDDFSPERVALAGVRLGDPESRIPQDQITETNEYGWRMLGSGARYLVKDKKVVTLALAGDLIKSLEIKSPEILTKKLGKPVREKKEFYGIRYISDARRIEADWVDNLGGLTVLRIGKPQK